MSKWSFDNVTFSPSAGVADAVAVTGGFMALGGGSATQYIKVQEIQEVGQAVATSANIMLWARDSTFGVTPTALATPNSMGPIDQNTAVLAAPNTAYVAAATGPQRSSSTTVAKLNMSFNAFGGILRWQAAPDEEWGIYGTSTTGGAGESSLSSFTGSGTGAMGCHIIFEVK